MMESDSSPTKKTINGLLNISKTRVAGFQLLSAHLPHCTDDDFIENCVNWMQACCKTDENSKDTKITLQILSSLFQISSSYPELNKPVSFFITNRFFDHFFKYFVSLPGGWSCAKTCFTHYRGPCGPSQDLIQRHLVDLLRDGVKISTDVAECFALLPCLGGPGSDGTNYRNNWRDQFLKYTYTGQSVMNDLFADVEEMQGYDTAGERYVCAKTHPELPDLMTALHNYCSILSSMLLISYPAPKSIPTELVLGLICRGLAVTPASLAKRPTTATLALEKCLPDVHATLLRLLNSVVVTCGTQMLPYSSVVCKLIRQVLAWTQSESACGREKRFGPLRVAAYEVICNWVVATKSGSGIDRISKLVISNVVSDVEFKKSAVLLKEKKSNKKRLSNGKPVSASCRVDEFANGCLCYSALQALNHLLKYSGVLLKPEDHRLLQETVIRLLTGIRNGFPVEVPVPFGLAKCRRALYQVLLELVSQPSSEWPPPTHFALRLFKSGERDSSPEVSRFCSSALNLLTVIIHRQFSNGPITEGHSANGSDGVRSEGPRQLAVESEEEDESEILDVTGSVHNRSLEDKCLSRESPSSDKMPESTVLSSDGERNSGSDSESSKSSDECSKTSSVIGNKDWSNQAVPSNMDVIEDVETSSVADAEMTESVSQEDTATADSDKQAKVDLNRSRGEETDGPAEPATTESTLSSGQPCQTPERETGARADTAEDSEPKTSPGPVKTPRGRGAKKASISEESQSDKSVTPDPATEEGKHMTDAKKRYFLRSKGKGSEDEPEETLRRTESVDSLKNTPKSLVKGTPSGRGRPRTRASTKRKMSEGETETPKKAPKATGDEEDDDDDIIETFNDAIVE